MDEIKSIWDGWEKQCFGVAYDEWGACCARGFTWKKCGGVTTEVVESELRVGKYLQQHYLLPFIYTHPISCAELHPRENVGAAIVYANNELKLTPEQFREIDRKTQVDEIAKNLLATVVEETSVVSPDVSAAALYCMIPN